MRPKVVTFDCAQTLVKVDWQPAALAVQAAGEAGIEFERTAAAEIYDKMLRLRWPQFKELNLTRDPVVLAGFWETLTEDWLKRAGMPVQRTGDVVEIANELLFGEDSQVFKIFDDTLRCLDELQAIGVRMAVISNWDNSLHRTLRMFGLTQYFEQVLASLEEGVEKPDVRLFEIALERLGVDPGDCLHVGDNPVDDLQGARNAGMNAVVIDRDSPTRSDELITSLTQLPEMMGT